MVVSAGVLGGLFLTVAIILAIVVCRRRRHSGQSKLGGGTSSDIAVVINKKDPNSKSSSGLLKHFLAGCPGDNPPNQSHLKVTILDSIKVDPVTLQRVGHVGQHCTCSECRRLKDCEDKNIIALGTFHPPHGLNERNEIRSQVRVNFGR